MRCRTVVMKQHLCSSDSTAENETQGLVRISVWGCYPISQICNYVLGQALRLPSMRLPLFLFPRHKLLLVSPVPSVLVHTSHISQVPGRIPVQFAPHWDELLKAHMSPCSHQWGSCSPKHGQLSSDVVLSQQPGLNSNWNLHRAVSLDNPRRRRAGVPCSSLLLVFLEGTESKASSELRKL